MTIGAVLLGLGLVVLAARTFLLERRLMAVEFELGIGRRKS
jgi:hypothetical protein